MIIASYDIECDSSHGDFPQAKKDYKKLANELISIHRDVPLSQEQIYKYLVQAFNQKEIHKDGISKLFTKEIATSISWIDLYKPDSIDPWKTGKALNIGISFLTTS